MASDTYRVFVPTETNADETIATLADLDQQVRTDTSALSAMKRALGALRGGGIEATETMSKLKDQIALQRGFVAQAQVKYIEAGGTFRKLGTDARAAGGALKTAGSDAVESATETDAAFDASKVAADEYADALARVSGQLVKTSTDPRQFDVSGALTKNSASAARVVTQLKILKTAGVDTGAAVDKLRADLAKLRAEGVALNIVSKQTAGGLNKIAVAAKTPVAAVKQSKRAFQDFGQVGQLVGGRIGGLASSLETMGQVGQSSTLIMTAAAGVYVVVAAAAVIATTAIIGYTIVLADAAREQKLVTEGSVRLANLLSKNSVDATVATENLGNAVFNVTNEVGLAKSKTNELGVSLFQMGLRGKGLESALKGAAIAQAAAGKAGVAAFNKQLKPIKDNATAVAKLARTYEKELGGVAEKRALSLGNQVSILKDDLKALFGGLKIEGVLKAFAKLRSLFTEGSESSKALMRAFEILFEPLTGPLPEQGANTVVRAVKKMIIAALDIRIAYLRARNAVIRTFRAWNEMSLGEVIAEVAKFVNSLSVKLVAGTIKAAKAAGSALWEALKIALSPAPAGKLGSDIVDGIIKGIQTSAVKLASAVAGLAKGAIKAFKGAIDSSSPSKVFAAEGVNIGDGTVMGVNATAPKVQASMVEMAKPPTEEIKKNQAEARAEIAPLAPKELATAALAPPPEIRINAPTLSPIPDAAKRPPPRDGAPPPVPALTPVSSAPVAAASSGAGAGGSAPPITIDQLILQLPEGTDVETAEGLAVGMRQALVDEFTTLAAQLGAKR